MVKADRITLGIIFERIKDQERFTDDALLYQKILSFSLSGADHQSFIKWEMCKWLKKNHKRFEKRSVVSLQELVARKIEKLLDLQLIHEIGSQPISTGTGQTPIYAFGASSYFLGWLIDGLDSDPIRKSDAINKIFIILYLMLENDVPMNVFLKSLIRKIKENDLFGYLANYMTILLESSDPIKDISELINQALIFRHADSNLINKNNELWEETLNELGLEVRQLVMFRIKLLYEQKMKERAHDLAQFEVARFAAKEKFDKLILECVCVLCPSIRYEMIDLIEYTIRLRYHIEGFPALEKNCPSCNNIGSLQIIDL